MNREKNSFSKLGFGESLIRGCSLVELKGKIPKILHFKNNLHFYFANLSTLYNGQLCLLGQILSEIKIRWRNNQY